MQTEQTYRIRKIIGIGSIAAGLLIGAGNYILVGHVAGCLGCVIPIMAGCHIILRVYFERKQFCATQLLWDKETKLK